MNKRDRQWLDSITPLDLRGFIDEHCRGEWKVFESDSRLGVKMMFHTGTKQINVYDSTAMWEFTEYQEEQAIAKFKEICESKLEEE